MIPWLAAVPLAQDPPPPSIEIVVVAERRVAAAKEDVHRALCGSRA